MEDGLGGLHCAGLRELPAYAAAITRWVYDGGRLWLGERLFIPATGAARPRGASGMARSL